MTQKLMLRVKSARACDASLVNTLPITKKNKHTVVTEAPKSTCAAFALANLLQKANSGSSWRPTDGQTDTHISLQETFEMPVETSTLR